MPFKSRVNSPAGTVQTPQCCPVELDQRMDLAGKVSVKLDRILATPKRGDEPFHRGCERLEFNLNAFWSWSVSDLVSNATRGRLAEFIVARALGVPTSCVRDEWGAFDLTTPAGTKVEVKSAAYVQSWSQRKLSAITFLVRKTRGWNPDTNIQDEQSCRQADVYVFALLAHQDKAAIDPMDLDQWRFYVLPTSILNQRQRSQHSITLSTLERLRAGPVGYADLKGAVSLAM